MKLAREENLKSLFEAITILKQIEAPDAVIITFAIKSIDLLQNKYIQLINVDLSIPHELEEENADLYMLIHCINNKALPLSIDLLDCLSSRNIAGVLNIHKHYMMNIGICVKYFKSQVAKDWFINNGY